MSTLIVDVVARGKNPNTFILVIVEQGPWAESSVAANMARLQDRLYDCVDAAIDGQVSEKFPESTGTKIIVRLDGYNLPQEQVQDFFARFSKGVQSAPDYVQAIAESRHVTSIDFELDLRELP